VNQAPQIDDLHVDPLFGGSFGGTFGKRDHRAITDERDVGPVAQLAGLADGHGKGRA
jgi:hypothetical protein